jgi:hypothetical protein
LGFFSGLARTTAAESEPNPTLGRLQQLHPGGRFTNLLSGVTIPSLWPRFHRETVGNKISVNFILDDGFNGTNSLEDLHLLIYI